LRSLCLYHAAMHSIIIQMRYVELPYDEMCVSVRLRLTRLRVKTRRSVLSIAAAVPSVATAAVSVVNLVSSCFGYSQRSMLLP